MIKAFVKHINYNEALRIGRRQGLSANEIVYLNYEEFGMDRVRGKCPEKIQGYRVKETQLWGIWCQADIDYLKKLGRIKSEVEDHDSEKGE